MPGIPTLPKGIHTDNGTAKKHSKREEPKQPEEPSAPTPPSPLSEDDSASPVN